jgi:hypothetical protein
LPPARRTPRQPTRLRDSAIHTHPRPPPVPPHHPLQHLAHPRPHGKPGTVGWGWAVQCRGVVMILSLGAVCQRLVVMTTRSVVIGVPTARQRLARVRGWT